MFNVKAFTSVPFSVMEMQSKSIHSKQETKKVISIPLGESKVLNGLNRNGSHNFESSIKER